MSVTIHRLLRPLVSLLGSLFVALAIACPVWAETDADQLKKARAQFQQATEMEQAGNYSGALQLFREVGQFRMTPQVRYHIALCEENLGRLVGALGGYELALAGADAVGPEFRAEVEEAIAKLRARIPKLVVERGSGAEAAQIELDGVTLGASSIGTEVPIDPGPHTITAKARGFADFNQTVEVAEQETKVVKVDLEPLAEPVEPTEQAPPVRDTGPAEPAGRFRWLPWAVGGGGVAVLAAGGIFFLLQGVKQDQLDTICHGQTQCQLSDPEQVENAKEKKQAAETYNLAGWIATGVGVAAVGAGVAIYVLQHRKQSPAKEKAGRVFFEPVAPCADAGLSFGARF